MNGRQFNVTGAGAFQTVLRGNTGDRAAVVEMVGTGFSKLSGVLIDDLVGALAGSSAGTRPLLRTLQLIGRERNSLTAPT